MMRTGFKFEIVRIDDRGVEHRMTSGEGWALYTHRCDLDEKTGKMRETITLEREDNG